MKLLFHASSGGLRMGIGKRERKGKGGKFYYFYNFAHILLTG